MTAQLIDITRDLPVGRANEDCVATLERLLELAKRGDVVTLAVAVICTDGEAAWAVCEADRPQRHLALLGALQLVARKIEDGLESKSDD
jgi:hypothetical protein